MHLSVVTEILQSIRQSEMTPILQRIHQSEGGSEVCDTLMKYLYKGMAQGSPGSNSGKNMTPQATGFSQAGGRSFGGAEGGGQAMSVLLSWHEKVIPHDLTYSKLAVYADLFSVGRNGWSWQHHQGHVGSPNGMNSISYCQHTRPKAPVSPQRSRPRIGVPRISRDRDERVMVGLDLFGACQN